MPPLSRIFVKIEKALVNSIECKNCLGDKCSVFFLLLA